MFRDFKISLFWQRICPSPKTGKKTIAATSVKKIIIPRLITSEVIVFINSMNAIVRPTIIIENDSTKAIALIMLPRFLYSPDVYAKTGFFFARYSIDVELISSIGDEFCLLFSGMVYPPRIIK